MQYPEIFLSCKNENFQQKNFDLFLIFAQNIHCECTLEPHNVCFESKIRKNTTANPSFLYKSGVKGGTHFTDMFS